MTEGGVAGRVIIVTGAGAGIGRGLVRHLGTCGARVVVAERNPERMKATIAELEAGAVECLGVICDVGIHSSIQSMVDATIERFGQVDALVNNANSHSTSELGPIAELSEEDLDVCFTSGLTGTLWGMQAVYPHMQRAGWGRIVNVGSPAGLVSFKGMAAHSATKEAICSLTRTAAREWANDGIVVNCYLPVSMGHHLGEYEPGGYTDISMSVLASLRPTGSVETNGDPEKDLGPVIEFLSSDACRYLTGQTLTLDGGAYAFA